MRVPGIARAALAACVLLGVTVRADDAPGGPFAAVQEAAARNQAALRHYSWIQTTQISVKGEVKSTKVESVLYGPDGTQQKIADPELISYLRAS